MSPMHLQLLQFASSLRFRLILSKKEFCHLPEQTAVSNIKAVSYTHLLDAVDSVYQKYNTLIDENECSIKYDIPHAHMFVIELSLIHI